MTTLLAIIYVSFLSIGLPASVLGSIWPQMQLDLGASLALAGYLSMTITGGTVLSSLLADRLVRKLDVGRTAVLGAMLATLSLLGFAASPSVALLFIFSALLGLGTGAIDAVLNNFVAVHFGASHMNWLHCFWGIGSLAGPLIVSAALRMGGSWQLVYGVIAAIQAVFCILLVVALPRWKKVPAAVQPEPVHNREKPKGIWKTRGIFWVLGGFLLASAVEMTTSLWGSSYLHEHFGLDPADAAVSSVYYFAAITIGRTFAGIAARWLSDDRLTRIGGLLCIVGAVVMALSPSASVALTGIAMMGLGIGPVYPAMLHLTPQRYGMTRSQAVMGFEMAFAYVGGTFVPPIFGALATALGAKTLPWFLLGAYVMMVGCIFWVPRCDRSTKTALKSENVISY